MTSPAPSPMVRAHLGAPLRSNNVRIAGMSLLQHVRRPTARRFEVWRYP